MPSHREGHILSPNRSLGTGGTEGPPCTSQQSARLWDVHSVRVCLLIRCLGHCSKMPLSASPLTAWGAHSPSPPGPGKPVPAPSCYMTLAEASWAESTEAHQHRCAERELSATPPAEPEARGCVWPRRVSTGHPKSARLGFQRPHQRGELPLPPFLSVRQITAAPDAPSVSLGGSGTVCCPEQGPISGGCVHTVILRNSEKASSRTTARLRGRDAGPQRHG